MNRDDCVCVQYAALVHSVVFGSVVCRDIDESDKEMTGAGRRTDGIKFLHNFPHLEATLTGCARKNEKRSKEKVFTVSFSEATENAVYLK